MCIYNYYSYINIYIYISYLIQVIQQIDPSALFVECCGVFDESELDRHSGHDCFELRLSLLSQTHLKMQEATEKS